MCLQTKVSALEFVAGGRCSTSSVDVQHSSKIGLWLEGVELRVLEIELDVCRSLMSC